MMQRVGVITEMRTTLYDTDQRSRTNHASLAALVAVAAAVESDNQTHTSLI